MFFLVLFGLIGEVILVIGKRLEIFLTTIYYCIKNILAINCYFIPCSKIFSSDRLKLMLLNKYDCPVLYLLKLIPKEIRE